MPASNISGTMLILAIDTSHKNGSVCLARGDARRCEVIGSAQVDGGMFSAQLVPVIARLLAQNNLTKNDAQGIAASVGPGSFTGLRIGLAAVKGFAEVLKIPVAAVSSLAALVASVEANEKVLALLDAGRKELYVGEYVAGKAVAERLLTLDELTAELRNKKDYFLVSSDLVLDPIVKQSGCRFQQVEPPDARIVARMGLQKLAAGDVVGAQELDANYVRRDAGLFSKP